MRAWAAILAALALAGCGGTARRGACAAAPVKTGAPPDWTAPAWADSSPNLRMPYPSYVDLPKPGCWRLDLAWGPHRARIDVAVAGSRTTPEALGGAPLKGRTGLRLLVAGAPPYVLDVDSGKVSRVRGLRFGRFRVAGVQGVGRDAAISVDPDRISILRHGSLRARPIGAGRQVAPGRGGRAVWVVEGRGSAALVEGASVRALPGGTPTRIAPPWAVAGPYVLGAGRPLTLTDRRTGKRRTFARPSAIRFPDEAAAAPDGRHIALDFADPAYHSTGTQVMDVWLLDAQTGRLTQLPGMPAIAHLKFTSFAWAPDGRLVLLSQDAGLVAVWRPGLARLAVRRVRLPRPSGGSDAFTVW